MKNKIEAVCVLNENNIKGTVIFKEKENNMVEITAKIKGLKEGYQIDAIEFEEEFNQQTNEETFFPGIIRKAVYPVANYSILISRSGGWLFVKLFLGSFLAFIISWIVFLIPNKEVIK